MDVLETAVEVDFIDEEVEDFLDDLVEWLGADPEAPYLELSVANAEK